MHLPRRRSMVSSMSGKPPGLTPSTTGPADTKATTKRPSSRRAAARRHQAGAVEHAVVVHEAPLARQTGDPQHAGHRAPARCQDGAGQQHFGVPPAQDWPKSSLGSFRACKDGLPPTIFRIVHSCLLA